MTARERIARHLVKHGEVRECEFDGSGGPVIDSGRPIRRVAPRIKELRDEGWEIRTVMDQGMARYVLVDAPGLRAVRASEATDVIAQWAGEAA